MTRRLRLSLVALGVATAAAGPAIPRQLRFPFLSTQPAARQPATTQSAVVDPSAEPLLAMLSAAYATTQPLHVVGKIIGQFDVAGRSHTYSMTIDGRTDGDGRFRHDAGDAGLIVGDGTHTYLYDRKRDAYAKLDGATSRQDASDIDRALIDVLLDENPALLMTLTDDPATLLRRAATGIHRAPATRTAENGLLLTESTKKITLWLDEAGAIRSSEVDFTPLMTARHATAVKAAHATLTYDHADRGSSPAGTFTWQAPASATEFEVSDNLMENAPPTTRPGRRSAVH